MALDSMASTSKGFTDFAPPISRHHYQGTNRRIPRPAVFFMGFFMGCGCLFSGWFIYNDIHEDRRSKPAWDTESLEYVGRSSEGRFFIRNTTEKDYQLEPEHIHIMEKRELGLVESRATVTASVFIPAKESAGVSIENIGDGDGPIVLFDNYRKFRITLGVEDARILHPPN